MFNRKGKVKTTQITEPTQTSIADLSGKGAEIRNSNQLFANSKQIYLKFHRKFLYSLKTIIDKPRWFLVFVIGRFQIVRLIYSNLSELFCDSQEVTNTDSHSLFPNLDVKEVIDILRKDGVYVGMCLPPNIVKDILQYTNSEDCFAGGMTNMGFKIPEKEQVDLVYDRPFYVARYFNVGTSCSSISKLKNDPILREIATKYIGKQAKYTGASFFWTFPVKDSSYDSDQQHFSHFHYDLDDYASVRFCFYLSDVTLENGPHICIRGSHVKKPMLHLINYFSRIQPETELIKYYGQEKFITLTGKAGFGFIEDTFCFHRGDVPQNQPRLFLQLHFAANNYNSVEQHDYRVSDTLKHFKVQNNSEV